MDEPVSTPEPAAEMPAEPEPAAVPAEVSLDASPSEALGEHSAVQNVVVAAESVSKTVPEMPAAEPPATAEVAPSEPETHTAPKPPADSSSSTHSALEDSAKGNAAKKQKVEQHLEHILAEAKKKKQVTNRDVVKLLRISDATASRYLKMLVTRGNLKKEGKGRSVRYSV